MFKKKKKEKKEEKKGKKEKSAKVAPEQGEKPENALDHDVKKSIFAVLIIMLALIFVLSLFGLAGAVGKYIEKSLSFLFGWGRFMLPLVMIVLGVFYFKKMKPIRYTLAAVGAIMFYLMFLGLAHMAIDMEQMASQAKLGLGGGYVGLGIAFSLAKSMGKFAGVIILVGMALIGIMLIFNAPLNSLFESLKQKLMLKKKEEMSGEEKEEEKEIGEGEEKNVAAEADAEEGRTTTDETAEAGITPIRPEPELHKNIKSFAIDESPQDELFKTEDPQKKKAKKKKNSNKYLKSGWQAPPLELLKRSDSRPFQENLDERVKLITKTFKSFDIEVIPGEHHVGPTVTQFTFEPGHGVRLSKITALQDNLSLVLAATIRIEAPIPGKSLIGVEVPNKEKSFVRMRTMLENEVFQEQESDLGIILGEDVNGFPALADIEKMPHMLIAGSTGTGKSVCINMILVTLLYKNSPEDLRLVLVDPKRVELTVYDKIPHLMTPVIADMNKVVPTLRWAINEMDRRYRLLQEVGSRDINSYNDKVEEGKERKIIDKETGEVRIEPLEKMPYIVIVIDELAQIMTAFGREVEGLIARLAQMSRAVGINLIVSTQRPSVEVITGLIKAQISTRVAFQVASQVDSRTILDMAGAEKLLGNGDMLFKNADGQKPKRVQGIFISEQEVKGVVHWIKKHSKEMYFDENEELTRSLEEQLKNVSESTGAPGIGGEEGEDELYEAAKELVIQNKKASTSMLQRRLKIGYGRAARIVDMLEENGVVGPPEGSKPRELLVSGEKDPSYEEGNEADDQEKREKWGR